MGPKGERGHPGSIVWNGIKVSRNAFTNVISMHDGSFV